MRWRAAAAVLALWPTLGAAATVRVRVLNVDSDVGTIRVAVCPKRDFLRPTCPYKAHAPAQRGAVEVSVEGVPDGLYAVEAHHDTNGNGRIDTSFFGAPTEGIGFSRDAAFHFGPPRFADAAVSISGALVTLDITLKFEP